MCWASFIPIKIDLRFFSRGSRRESLEAKDGNKEEIACFGKDTAGGKSNAPL